jgi:hypothetical protein
MHNEVTTMNGGAKPTQYAVPTPLCVDLPATDSPVHVFVKGSWDNWTVPVKVEPVAVKTGTGLVSYRVEIDLRDCGTYSFKFLVRASGERDMWMCSPLHKSTFDECGNENNCVIVV